MSAVASWRFGGRSSAAQNMIFKKKKKCDFMFQFCIFAMISSILCSQSFTLSSNLSISWKSVVKPLLCKTSICWFSNAKFDGDKTSWFKSWFIGKDCFLAQRMYNHVKNFIFVTKVISMEYQHWLKCDNDKCILYSIWTQFGGFPNLPSLPRNCWTQRMKIHQKVSFYNTASEASKVYFQTIRLFEFSRQKF